MRTHQSPYMGARMYLQQEPVALKVIQKTRLNKTEQQLLAEEVRISQGVDNKFCVRTHEFIENASAFVLVMEFVGGGELFERLLYHRYPESEVRVMSKQLLAGVAYLHSRNIAHRDLKPENVLLTSERPMTLKIADYGIATDVSSDRPADSLRDGDQLRCSPGYGAPEIVNQLAYGLPCDMWSLGVVIFLLLTGRQPFNGKTPEETRALMQAGTFDPDLLSGCSVLAGDFVARLLDRDPSTRIKADDALSHPWVVGAGSEGADGSPAARPPWEEPGSAAGCGCCQGLLEAMGWRGGYAHEPAFADPSMHSMAVPQKPTGVADTSVRNGFFHAFGRGGGGGGGDASNSSRRNKRGSGRCESAPADGSWHTVHYSPSREESVRALGRLADGSSHGRPVGGAMLDLERSDTVCVCVCVCV